MGRQKQSGPVEVSSSPSLSFSPPGPGDRSPPQQTKRSLLNGRNEGVVRTTTPADPAPKHHRSHSCPELVHTSSPSPPRESSGSSDSGQDEPDEPPPKQAVASSPETEDTKPLTGGDSSSSSNSSNSSSESRVSSTIRLACPYFKLDAQRYRDCSRYILRRVKDIKQHIQRRHRGPEFHCSVCSEVFSTKGCKEDHAMRGPCQALPMPKFEGISEQQRQELKRYMSRGKPLQDQWFDMWNIIFPGRTRPKSIYLDTGCQGGMGGGTGPTRLLRKLWSERKAQITELALKRMQPRSSSSNSINQGRLLDTIALDDVMEIFFEQVDTETPTADDDSHESTTATTSPDLSNPQQSLLPDLFSPPELTRRDSPHTSTTSSTSSESSVFESASSPSWTLYNEFPGFFGGPAPFGSDSPVSPYVQSVYLQPQLEFSRDADATLADFYPEHPPTRRRSTTTMCYNLDHSGDGGGDSVVALSCDSPDCALPVCKREQRVAAAAAAGIMAPPSGFGAFCRSPEQAANTMATCLDPIAMTYGFQGFDWETPCISGGETEWS